MSDNAHQSQPLIVRYVQPDRSGVQSHNLTRHAIGYLLNGTKHIFHGDLMQEIHRGELFYLNIGNHYMEDIPEGNKPCEQIIFYFTPEMLRKAISTLSVNYGMQVDSSYSESDTDVSHLAYPAWENAKVFFNGVSQYLKNSLYSEDDVAEKMSITELVYHIVSNSDCPIRNKIMQKAYLASDSFERIVNDSIFEDISIEELARKCNKSMTSFKKEFRRIFNDSPHKWFIRQRLMRSRLLLVTSNKSIALIGSECGFSNTSHYIKLFKNEYGFTPSVYRSMSRKEKGKKEKVLVPEMEQMASA